MRDALDLGTEFKREPKYSVIKINNVIFKKFKINVEKSMVNKMSKT